jgi:hypothetical protein
MYMWCVPQHSNLFKDLHLKIYDSYQYQDPRWYTA